MKSILLFFFSLSIVCSTVGQCPYLPTSLPNSETELEAANRLIAECFAPTIHQMAETGAVQNSANGRADLITSVFYDGDMNTGNNWQSLDDFAFGNPMDHDELDPVIYYSVVWTNAAWIITYAAYHPRDYSDMGACCIDNHENDLEGAFIVVNRGFQGIPFGTVMGAYTMHHQTMIFFDDITTVPELFIDNGTHAVNANLGSGCITDWENPCDNCKGFDEPHITYTPSTDGNSFVNATVSSTHDENLQGTGSYLLEDIFGTHSSSLNNQRNNPTVFDGDKFFQETPNPNNHDCMNQGHGSAPWGFSQVNYTSSSIKDLLCFAHFGGGFCFTASAFVEIQFQNVIIENNPYFPNTCDNNFPLSVQINDHTNWDLLESLEFQNITVKAGKTLTIDNRRINFVEDGTITLEPGSELIMIQSTLGTCDEETQWHGIIAREGATIDMYQSRIENAQVGMRLGRTGFAAIINPTNNNRVSIRHYSGFKNCDVGLRIGKGEIDGHISGRSWFEDCEVGILATDSRGLRLDRTEFYNNTEAIRSIDSYMHIRDGNAFHGGDVAISLEGTFPLTSGIDIGDEGQGYNFFANNRVAIEAHGNESPAGANIVNCRFDHNTERAVMMSGANDYKFINNNIDDTENGLIAGATGDNFNDANCNIISNIENVGCFYFFDNQESSFLENQFDENQNVMVVALNATLKEEIGKSTEAASNCFSDNGADIFASDFFSFFPAGQSFDYHFFDDSDTEDCQEPINTGNYDKFGADVTFGNCNEEVGVFEDELVGPSTGGTHTSVVDPLYDPDDACIKCIKDSINQWIAVVVQTGGDDPTTAVDEEVPTSDPVYEETMTEWINYGLYVAIATNNNQLGEDILGPLKKWRWQKRLFGFRVLMGDLNGAQQVLDGLNTSTPNRANFKVIQQINMKRLRGFENGNYLTQADLDQLRVLAQEPYPSAGYARSLYRFFTGDRLPYDLPNIDRNKTTPRSINTSATVSDNFVLYPNPATNILYIGQAKGQIDKVIIQSIDGRLQTLAIDDSGKESINISGLENGVYLVRIRTLEGQELIQKFVKQ